MLACKVICDKVFFNLRILHVFIHVRLWLSTF